MKHLFNAIALTLLGFSGLSAQTLTPSVLASDGGSATGAGIRLDYTLGELAVDGLTGQRMSMTEGFHQPILHIVPLDGSAAIPDRPVSPDAGIRIDLAPNPVTAELIIRFDAPTPATLSLYVHDANGILVYQRTLDTADGDSQVDMSRLPAGVYYFLFTSSDPDFTSTCQIVKTQ